MSGSYDSRRDPLSMLLGFGAWFTACLAMAVLLLEWLYALGRFLLDIRLLIRLAAWRKAR